MASPVDSARQGTNITTAATSHAINVGSPVAGTLLIVMVRFAGAPGAVTFTGYTQFAADTSDASDDDTRLYYRQADGAEGATDTLSTGNSIKLAAICWEVTGAENPATTAPSVSAVAIGTAANINPAGFPSATVDTTGAAFTTGESLNGGSGVNSLLAQSFQASGTQISQVRLVLHKAGTPTDNVLVELQTDSAGSPSGTSVGSIGSISASTLTASNVAYDFACSLAVTNSTTYWIVLSRSGSVDSSNCARWQINDSASIYAGGLMRARTSGVWGATFNNAFDAAFATFGPALVSNDYLFLTIIGMDSETATATAPSGYANTQSANSGTGGAVATNCMIWGASKQATAVTSDDPGAWTSTAPNSGVTAWTIAIPAPAAPAAPGPASSRRRRQASRYLTFR